MSKTPKEVCAESEESKFKGVYHVNVDKTVEKIKQELQEN
jgi:hypothetical protein